MLPSSSSTSSLSPVEVPFKGRSGGGLEAIGLTIGMNPQIPVPAVRSLTQFRYTDTDLDPYNADHGFWWVSGCLSPSSFFSTQ